jgi:hypothetical protein
MELSFLPVKVCSAHPDKHLVCLGCAVRLSGSCWYLTNIENSADPKDWKLEFSLSKWGGGIYLRNSEHNTGTGSGSGSRSGSGSAGASGAAGAGAGAGTGGSHSSSLQAQQQSQPQPQSHPRRLSTAPPPQHGETQRREGIFACPICSTYFCM